MFSASLLLFSLETTHFFFISREDVSIFLGLLACICLSRGNPEARVCPARFQNSWQAVLQQAATIFDILDMSPPRSVVWERVPSATQDLSVCLLSMRPDCPFGLASRVGPGEEEWSTSSLLKLPGNWWNLSRLGAAWKMLFTVPNCSKVTSWELPRPQELCPPPCAPGAGSAAGSLALLGSPEGGAGPRLGTPIAAGGELLPAAGPAPPPAGRRGRLPLRRRPAGAWEVSQRPHITKTPGKAEKCIVPKRLVSELPRP